MATTTVLLCGVGGQGTILAADLLAHAALAAGKDVKVSAIHGMAQRGGAVSTVGRFGDAVRSMVTDIGAADVVVSFEKTEALRNIAFLKDGGALIVNDESIKPLPVLTGKAEMPEHPREDLEALGAVLVPAEQVARELGNAKTSNVVLLGALAARLDFPHEAWVETVSTRVPPRTVEVNLEAFEAGYSLGTDKQEEGYQA